MGGALWHGRSTAETSMEWALSDVQLDCQHLGGRSTAETSMEWAQKLTNFIGGIMQAPQYC